MSQRPDQNESTKYTPRNASDRSNQRSNAGDIDADARRDQTVPGGIDADATRDRTMPGDFDAAATRDQAVSGDTNPAFTRDETNAGPSVAQTTGPVTDPAVDPVAEGLGGPKPQGNRDLTVGDPVIGGEPAAPGTPEYRDEVRQTGDAPGGIGGGLLWPAIILLIVAVILILWFVL